MTLVESIHTTSDIKTVARKLALLLRESDAMKVKTKDERMRWFKYPRVKSRDDAFDTLLEEIKTIVCIRNKYASTVLLMSKGKRH
jgi:hypothetical protein